MLKAKCVSVSVAVGFDVTLLEPGFLSPLPSPLSPCEVLSQGGGGELGDQTGASPPLGSLCLAGNTPRSPVLCCSLIFKGSGLCPHHGGLYRWP